MQRFRFLSVVLATSLGSGAFVAQADPDTPAQAAARAALQQQMNQSGAEEPPAMTNSTTPPPLVTPPPVTTPTPQFSTNVPINISTNLPTDDETESGVAGIPTNGPAMAPLKSQTNMGAITAPPPSVLNTNETEQYPVNPAMAPLPPPPLDATSVASPTAPPIHPMPLPSPLNSTVPASTTPSGPGPSLQGEGKGTNSAPNFETITAPPLPITPEKQSELQSLLSQYLANQLTPAQYQEQRAKIMAEP